MKKISLILVAMALVLAMAAVALGQTRDFHKNHPELRAEEIFIGNFTAREVGEIRWKTKRMGEKALNRDGVPISNLGWQGGYPVFVQKSELMEAGVDP
ncbi:MAG: hypothetical protein A2359_04665 [Candidatus Moranbacteria bacterium RIFOXYB1_FULL_43_19]|nr:MAG: hypothetical protein A2359_04665 [Candidatus Moranbacteria bacterium RIFOXYB1_FULL_43_19]OGI33900.1 MAG: hypothetical protein A2420_01770 [Candidatus Moranbacteria bacterium RIFOXYC1_FULL_44_13]OGI38306.1 MAG: hypothetical protein A2612_03785 [Candidatus Moranbacteria bacterium RIFOXYD1_FULL_44_12]